MISKKWVKGVILWIIGLVFVISIFGFKINVIIPTIGVLSGFLILYYGSSNLLQIFFILGCGSIGFLIGLVFLIEILEFVFNVEFTKIENIILLCIFFIIGVFLGYFITKRSKKFQMFLLKEQ